MIINDIRNEDTLTVSLEGRLDFLSAAELDKHLEKYYPVISRLVLDFQKLDYLSSAGLRVILKAHTALQDKGGVVIRRANRLVMGIFDVTGFSDILCIEE